MLQKRIDDQPSISPEMVREAQDILHQHLKKVGLKQTAQRDTILRTFLETRDHLSTDELFRLVKKKDPRIGYTTVYRTLEAAGRVPPGQRSGIPRRHRALRASVQPAQPSPHGLHRLRQFGRVFFERSGEARARDWPQVSLHDHAAFIPDIRCVRRLSKEERNTAGGVGGGQRLGTLIRQQPLKPEASALPRRLPSTCVYQRVQPLRPRAS